MSPPAGPGTVEEMRSGNLQYREPNYVENMQSGGLQYHTSNNFQGETPQYAENMQSGGLQYHDPYTPQGHSNEELPPPVDTEKTDPLVELSAVRNQENGPSSGRRICGLTRWMFWLLAVILALIVIGAAVGGAVAGTQKNRSSTSPDSAASTIMPVGSSSSASVVAPSTVTVILSTSASIATPITLTTPSGPASTSSAGSKPSNSLESSSTFAAISAGPATSSTPAAASTSPAPAPNTVTVVSTAPATSPNVVVSSAVQASATPTLAAVTPARANSANVDGNYFVNCHNSSQVSSGMAYYKNLNPGSNVGQGPDDYIDVVHGSYLAWQNGGAVTFHTGVVVHWAFASNPISGVNQRVGTADNTYENFYVYRDAGEFLYSTDGWSCYSQYWAF